MRISLRSSCPIRLDSKMSQSRPAFRTSVTPGSDKPGLSSVSICWARALTFPPLKVAAIHDPHKSLAVTLQFVGRFARVGGEGLGDCKRLRAAACR